MASGLCISAGQKIAELAPGLSARMCPAVPATLVRACTCWGACSLALEGGGELHGAGSSGEAELGRQRLRGGAGAAHQLAVAACGAGRGRGDCRMLGLAGEAKAAALLRPAP